MPAPETQPVRIPESAPRISSGRYRLLQKLGEGGMAAVYRAWDEELQRGCAVKVLLPVFSRKRKLRKRFENEASLMAHIEHRHVISVFDVGTDEALPYIVMELAEGGSLIDWTDRYGAMPARMAVDVVMQVCKGIGAAHDLGVVHRDVKPHNVLITHRGVCKVTDFGIAHIDEASLTKTGSVLGTLGYMAPEQRTDSARVDVRADVYSIGATLYKLLTDHNIADLFLAEHDDSLLEGVPEALAPVILRATAYRPGDRYDDVAQLARALFDARGSLPAIPDDTPPLPLPSDPRPAQGSEGFEEAAFSEIEPLLGAQPTLDTEGDQAEPKLLPYVMPAREQQVSEELPSWLDPSAAEAERLRAHSAPPSLPPQPATLEEEPAEEASDAPGTQQEQGLDALENLRDFVITVISSAVQVLWKPLSALAVPLGGLSVVLVLMLASPTMTLRSAETAALDARAELYLALEDERRIIDDLAALGGNREALEAYWTTVVQTPEEPARYDAAARFVSQIEQQMRLVGGRSSGALGSRAEQARVRFTRIEQRLVAYEQALVAWEQAASDGRARLVLRMGLARGP